MDFYRHWGINGASLRQIWNAKAKQVQSKQCVIRNEEDEEYLLWNNDKCQNVCRAILKSSTKTNEWVDGVTGAKRNKPNPKRSNMRNRNKKTSKPPRVEDLDINEMIHNEL